MRLNNLERMKENVINENIQFETKEEAINYMKDYIMQIRAHKDDSIDKNLFEFFKKYESIEKAENTITSDEGPDFSKSENIHDKKEMKLSGKVKAIRSELREKKRLKDIQLQRRKRNQVEKKRNDMNIFKIDVTSPEFIINSFIQKLDNIENKMEKVKDFDRIL